MKIGVGCDVCQTWRLFGSFLSSQNSIEEKEVDLRSELIGLNEVTSLEDLVQEVQEEVVSEAKEQEDEDKENEAEKEEEMGESAAPEAVTGVEMGNEKKEEDHQGPSTSADMDVDVFPVREQDDSVEMLGNRLVKFLTVSSQHWSEYDSIWESVWERDD